MPAFFAASSMRRTSSFFTSSERRGGVEGRTFWRVEDRGQAIRFALQLAHPYHATMQHHVRHAIANPLILLGILNFENCVKSISYGVVVTKSDILILR